MWDKLKAACLRSLTVAWSCLLGIFSAALMNLDDLAALVGDSTFSQQVQGLIGADPKVLGKWLSIVAAITIASRLRGIVAKKAA
jgi:hypothetical protein